MQYISAMIRTRRSWLELGRVVHTLRWVNMFCVSANHLRMDFEEEKNRVLYAWKHELLSLNREWFFRASLGAWIPERSGIISTCMSSICFPVAYTGTYHSTKRRGKKSRIAARHKKKQTYHSPSTPKHRTREQYFTKCQRGTRYTRDRWRNSMRREYN